MSNSHYQLPIKTDWVDEWKQFFLRGSGAKDYALFTLAKWPCGPRGSPPPGSVRHVDGLGIVVVHVVVAMPEGPTGMDYWLSCNNLIGVIWSKDIRAVFPSALYIGYGPGKRQY